jgi:hypothetical protein
MNVLDQAAQDDELIDRLKHLWWHRCLSEDESIWLEAVSDRLASKPLGKLTSNLTGRSVRASLSVYVSTLTADERQRGDGIVRRFV